jgi:hypothetical protein
MADAVFGEPRLAAVYDAVEGERRVDLDHYLAIAEEFEAATLRGVHAALRSGGHLVFEVRDPSRRAWERWTRENTYQRLDLPGIGCVETWWDLTGVDGALVSYRRMYVFAADGSTLTSDSTRRFWTRAEIEDSLGAAGYALAEVRDAPDRPGREWVFIARKP